MFNLHSCSSFDLKYNSGLSYIQIVSLKAHYHPEYFDIVSGKPE